MEFKPAEKTEYDVIIDEKIKECLPAKYGVGMTPDGKRSFAAIMLKEHLKNKELYQDADIKSWWEAAHDKNRGLEKVFLTMNFGERGERSLKFYIDLYDLDFAIIRDLWFGLIIETDCMIAMSDKREPSIIATNVPLDIPKFILEYKRI